MHAMVFERQGRPLRLTELPDPEPAPGQLRVRVSACGVCRTDLHIIDGDLEEPKLPNAGGSARVSTFDSISIACDAWGTGSCS